jgi:hypothetical protein
MIVKRRFRGVRQNLKRFRAYWSRKIYEKGWKGFREKRIRYRPKPKVKE